MKLKKLYNKKNNSKYRVMQLYNSKYLESLPENFLSKTGLTKSDLEDRFKNQYFCSDYITLEDDEECLDEKKILQANWCNQPTCDICNSRLQEKRRIKYFKKIEQISDNYKYAWFVTYTIKNGYDLEERLNHLRESLKRWRKKGQKGRTGEYSKVKAGLMTIEIKRGKNSGLWHVHGHAVLFSDERLDYRVFDPAIMTNHDRVLYNAKKIPKEKLMKYARFTDSNGRALSKVSKEWLDSTGDSFSMKIIPIKVSWESVCEVLKYQIKDSGYNPQDMIDIVVNTHNRRFLSTFGDLIGIEDVSETEMNDSLTGKKTITLQYKSTSRMFDVCSDPNYKIFDETKETENAKRIMKLVGESLAEYRRLRRKIMNSDMYDYAKVKELNFEKQKFRMKISAIRKALACA